MKRSEEVQDLALPATSITTLSGQVLDFSDLNPNVIRVWDIIWSLSNIVRHAHASSVRVELRSNGRQLTMTVSDNGIGLRARERCKVGSFGLVGIEERISILGGSFSISSIDGEGTTVCVSVPLYAEPGQTGVHATAARPVHEAGV